MDKGTSICADNTVFCDLFCRAIAINGSILYNETIKKQREDKKMIAVIKTVISVFMAVTCFFTSGFFGKYAGKISPVDKDNVRLSFATISDSHLTDSKLRAAMLELGFYDMEHAETPLDALVFVGDNTDHGYVEQYELLKETAAKYTPAKHMLMAVGNHDTWTEDENGEDSPALTKEYFLKYVNEITGRDISELYYTAEINGYTFIMLGSESTHTDAYISPAQLQWLDAEMAKAAGKGKPVFVVSHWPINGSHGLPGTWGDKDPEPDDGGFGDQSDDIENILKKYDDVFLISGHIHSGFTAPGQKDVYGYLSVESDGNFHSVNLPSYMYMSTRGRISNGTGYVIEVYDDEVLIRARSYSAGVWYTLYDYEIPLSTAEGNPGRLDGGKIC